MVGILRHCHFQNITTGNESYYNNKDNLEVHHDGVHDWVGGDMDEVRISSFDPIFWMHHAFIDYIWEQFRERQSSSECNVDVETDYPKTNLSRFNNSLNAATDPLHGFEYMQIKDGLWKNWTTKFFKYEPQPQCPDCGGSPFLTCDQEVDKERYPDGVCVSKDWDACHSVKKVDKE
ncbi:tyrosinase-like protein, partial [Mya arenaria]